MLRLFSVHFFASVWFAVCVCCCFLGVGGAVFFFGSNSEEELNELDQRNVSLLVLPSSLPLLGGPLQGIVDGCMHCKCQKTRNGAV